jgi:hypothetical protein
MPTKRAYKPKVMRMKMIKVPSMGNGKNVMLMVKPIAGRALQAGGASVIRDVRKLLNKKR